MTVDASLVVALTLVNEMIGATGVVACRAADVLGELDAAGAAEVGGYTDGVIDRRAANERRTWEPRCLGDCYTFCDTAARILLRLMRALRFILDARRPIK
jgi:hypothetical protein